MEVRAPGYVKKVYDPARQAAIKDFIRTQIAPIKDAAGAYGVQPDEIDVAMGWPDWTWDTVARAA